MVSSTDRLQVFKFCAKTEQTDDIQISDRDSHHYVYGNHHRMLAANHIYQRAVFAQVYERSTLGHCWVQHTSVRMPGYLHDGETCRDIRCDCRVSSMETMLQRLQLTSSGSRFAAVQVVFVSSNGVAVI